MDQPTLERLSGKVERLLEYCDKLEEDNAQLRGEQKDWHLERSKLLQKNDLARTKIEAMISRLKTLEKA